jgi:tRNA(adenine34) deaminase
LDESPEIGVSMNDEQAMEHALAAARVAGEAGEVPIGAVVLREGRIVGTGYNHPIGSRDPSAHAEIQAMREAAKALGNYRLDGCTLVVTVEPCTMCAGAALNARLARLVYGAAEPKTGAAGSVHNVFAHTQINHQTEVVGGVRQEECAHALQSFFKQRRQAQRDRLWPLRDDALRNPEEAFNGLVDWPFEPHYVNDLPALNGLRMAYVDEGPKDASVTWVLLHGNPTWSYAWRHWINRLSAMGHRVLAPDLIGFGRSDKPKKMATHSFDFHRQVLLEWIERLDVRGVRLAVQDWGGLLGLTLPMAAPERYSGLLMLNTTLATGEVPLSEGFVAWRQFCRDKPQFSVGGLLKRACPHLGVDEGSAYDLPFPDSGHRAALRRFPEMLADEPQAAGAAVAREAAHFWQTQWTGRAAMVVGMADPVLASAMPTLQSLVRGCAPAIALPQAGHFTQEFLHPKLPEAGWFDAVVNALT